MKDLLELLEALLAVPGVFSAVALTPAPGHILVVVKGGEPDAIDATLRWWQPLGRHHFTLQHNRGVRCVECGGFGKRPLFTSTYRCERCSGLGVVV